MAVDAPPGWFGKLAMLGDFASRRLDPACVRACDQWLSAGIRASREALGDRWVQVYLAAPAWRFAWGPGVVGTSWWFGVVMPSCDSVGRYYPLVIAQPRARPPADRIALDHLELWWRHLLQAGLASLADGATLEDFEAALAAAPRWPTPAPRAWARGAAGDGHERWQLLPGSGLYELASGLAAEGLAQRLEGVTAWWPAGEPGTAGVCSLASGLPPPAALTELLLGRW